MSESDTSVAGNSSENVRHTDKVGETKRVTPLYYRTNWRSLSGWLWLIVNVEVVAGSIWAGLLLFTGLFAPLELFSHTILSVLHVVCPLSVLLSIEYIFTKSESLHYITKLTWLFPAVYCFVADFASAFSSYKLYQEFVEAHDSPSLTLVQILYMVNIGLNSTLAFLSFVSIIALSLAYTAHNKRYPVKTAIDDEDLDEQSSSENDNSHTRQRRRRLKKLYQRCKTIEGFSFYFAILVVAIAVIIAAILYM